MNAPIKLFGVSNSNKSDHPNANNNVINDVANSNNNNNNNHNSSSNIDE